jgi:hypothetical protein
MFTAVGAALFFLAACAWIFANRTYAAIDPQDPRKQLAEEVAFTLKTRTAVAAAGAAAMFNGLVGRDAVESDGVAPDAEDVESADSSLDGVGSENRLGQAAGRGSL